MSGVSVDSQPIKSLAHGMLASWQDHPVGTNKILFNLYTKYLRPVNKRLNVKWNFFLNNRNG